MQRTPQSRLSSSKLLTKPALIFAGLIGVLALYATFGLQKDTHWHGWAGFLPVLCLLGGVPLGLVLKSRFDAFWRKPNRSRVDTLREPLIARHTLWQTDAADPLRGWKFHDTYQVPEELTVQDGIMAFSTAAKTNDEWDYIFLDPAHCRWSDFSWQLTIKRITSFREFALNFRYQDFDNRYRYRFEDDKLFFDKKVRGEWINNIASIPFTMDLGRWYQVRIEACTTVFRCYVDGQLALENVDCDLADGSICVILWEDDGRTPMQAEVGPMTVCSLRETVLPPDSVADPAAVNSLD